jgi:hypothetical protein
MNNKLLDITYKSFDLSQDIMTEISRFWYDMHEGDITKNDLTRIKKLIENADTLKHKLSHVYIKMLDQLPLHSEERK